MATKLKDVKDWYNLPPVKAPEPPLRGHKIEGYRYHSKDFFDLEWENMWTKVWLLLGRESEIPEPGDYQMEEVGPESFIMVRQNDGSLKAFYNVCQHRGARLVFNDIGFTDELTCPYHGWGWQLDGSLKHVQDPEDFPEGDPCGKLTLEEVKCETFAGFIWINMDPDCVPLKEYLGDVVEQWEAYEVEKWGRYLALTTVIPCNWKVIQDNFNESYHLPTVHPESDTSVECSYQETQFDMYDTGHHRMWMLSGRPSHTMEQSQGDILREPMISTLKNYGIDPEEYKDRPYDVREPLQKAKRKYGEEHGYTHYENLKDHQITDTYHYNIFPNVSVSVWADGFHFLRARPHPTDPTRALFDNWWYASEPEGETGPVFTAAGPVERGTEVEHDVFEYGEKSLGFAIDQDMAVTPGQQLGFRSRAFKGVYLSGQERRIRHYHEVIDDYIEGRRTAAKPHG
ncbi:MAG: aromatic ring-hydroxylating dioxygenase subunit alpha [Proteobacteria bacterium]|nr:aromatic ring-hydroxylating dioxygenase subunit alpha [Pseudomonadota bacterium]